MYASGLDVAAKDRLFERNSGILFKKKVTGLKETSDLKEKSYVFDLWEQYTVNHVYHTIACQ